MCSALGRVEVSGFSNIPPSGPVLLAVNHRALLDGPLLFGLIERPVTFLVKSQAFHPQPLGRILRSAGQVAVARGLVDRPPLRLLLTTLQVGGVVGVFPEGSRGDGRAGAARPGIGWLALRSGAPVVPVACHGTPSLVGGRRVPRPVVRIAVGPPLPVTPWPPSQPLPWRTFSAETERVRVALAELVRASAPTIDDDGRWQ